MDAQEAKDFLIKRVVQQAQDEQSPLSPIEQKMLKWTEVHPIPSEELPAIAEEFSSRFDDEEWEEKIAGLLRRAYQHDLKADSSAKQRYKDAVSALRQQDHYILVMVEAAGL